CGIENGDLQKGDSTLTKYPWTVVVSISFDSNNDPLKTGDIYFDSTKQKVAYQISGAIINSHYVLTTASLIYQRNYNDIFVHFGNHDELRSMLEVESVKTHEKFKLKGRQYNNDIALIKLKEAVWFDEKIRPICLPNEETNINQTIFNIAFYADFYTEWGQLPITARKFVDLEMNLVPMDNCTKFYQNYFLSYPYKLDAKKHLCAVDAKGNVMPLGAILMDKSSEQSFAAGLLSFMSNTTKNFPQVFTNVSNYVTWIKNNTVVGEYCDD
ncbi:Serine proteinase stubble-like protein, partial [Leptotrombidium deliense]